MIFRTIFYSILFLCIWGCSQNGGNNTLVTISNGVTPISEIVDRYHYLQLQLPEGIMIGGIQQVQHFEDYIFLLDGQVGRQLLIFSKDGEFRSQIKHAPDEGVLMMWPSFFQLDTQKKQIHLVDGSLALYYIFDLDGKLVEKKTLEEPFVKFLLMPDGRVFSDHGNSKSTMYGLILRNSMMERELSLFPVPTELIGHHVGSVISDNNTYPFYLQALTNKIYRVEESQTEPSLLWELEFPSGWPKQETLEKMAHLAPYEFANEFRKDHPFLSNSFENKDFFAISHYDADFQANAVFIDKKKGKSLGNLTLEDDMGIGCISRLVGQHKDSFISYILPEDLLAEKEKFQNNPHLSSLLDNLSSEDHPILVYYSLKK